MRFFQQILSKAFKLFLWLVAVLVILMAWYAWYASTPVLVPYTRPAGDIRRAEGLDLRFLEFDGADGVKVDACIVSMKNQGGETTPRLSRMRDLLRNRGKLSNLERQPGIVLISTTWNHGIENSMNYAESLASAGYTCVLWNSRGRDQVRPYCSYGYYESADVPLLLDAVEKELGDTAPVAAVGQGFGAALLMQSAVREPRIRCVVAMDSFCILKSAIMRAMEDDMGKPTCYAAFWLAELGICTRAGYSSYDVVPVDAARDLTVPAMLVCTDELFFSDMKDTLTLYSAVTSENKVVYNGRADGEPYGTKTREHVQMVEGKKGEKFEERYQIHVYDGEDDLMASVAEWIQDNNRLPKPKVLPGEIPGSARKI